MKLLIRAKVTNQMLANLSSVGYRSNHRDLFAQDTG